MFGEILCFKTGVPSPWLFFYVLDSFQGELRHAVSCRHWHKSYVDWKLTCHPKRRHPLLLTDHPPCRLLLLLLQQPMGGVQSYEGCQLLKITKTTSLVLRYCVLLTWQKLICSVQWHTHVVPLSTGITVRIIVVVGHKFEAHLWIGLCTGQFPFHLWLNSVKIRQIHYILSSKAQRNDSIVTDTGLYLLFCQSN